MFSQTTEYALRVAVYLAAMEGKPATIAQIAAATKTPEGYLAKVLRNLAKAGLVISQRGLHGGSILARSPEQITVYDVMSAVDPLQRIITCPLKLESHGTNLCPLHRRLDDALGLVEEALRASTLAELIAAPTESRPLVDLPDRVAARAFPVAKRASLRVRK